ncbi:2,3-dihydroxybiphenyl 1,2-dioxygenase [Bhargavaea cecembensis]|uniref:2,3-dihydroxybiphenyl 1,2-dioxygenase n=1 Tax=Bhargavaea cecembensis TaxID=394098 RepID=A0A161SSZ6_9BACL|nr:VOC family protein [Bhargavaea cecembensis]KZE38740.1 2,3-dihydroxybiphenyl 1,2-dioxygenase [Bhargavaea cecembensis]
MERPEIAKLGYVALVSSDLEKSLTFFRDVIGLEETAEIDGVHYLRAWGDFQHHTLSVEQGESGYVKHIGWRTKRREDVEGFRALLEEQDLSVRTVPAWETPGIGEAIRFSLPSGHTFELYYDVEKPEVEEHRRSVLKNQTYKAWAKGISPRRFDHVNLHTSQQAPETFEFLQNVLGFKMRELLENDNQDILAGWMSVTQLVHDVAFVARPETDTPARVHHISYWSDDSQDILRAADILKEHGFDFVGPGKHSISQAMYLYVTDPGSGCRVELFTGGYLIFEPDWEPVRWHESERAFGNTYWGDSINAKELVKTTIEAR